MSKTSWVLALGSALALATAMTPAYAARTDVNVGAVLEPPGLDPTANAAEATDQVVYSNIFEGLTKFDASGTIQPGLASSWDVSADATEYTFHLHDGVKFHDGTTMDAEDVKFSLDRARAPDSVNAQKALFAGIAAVDVVDPMTVKITLSQPNGNLPFNLAWGDAVIVAPETADNNDTHPVGTGPFVFGEWQRGQSVTITKNPDYWGTPVKLDKAVFKYIADPTAAYAAMMAGDVDAYPNFAAIETVPQFEGDPRFKVVIGTTEGETILAMNNAKAPFNDIRVREAVAHAIDRQAIIDGAEEGYGTPIGSHFAPFNPAYIDLTAMSNYDPDKSKALLAEAGYPQGFTTTLQLPPTPYARKGGEIIAAQLKAVGITAEISNIEWAQWLDKVFTQKDFDLTVISHTEPMDIDIYARDDYYFGYKSDEFKKIMADLTATTDPQKRTELLQQAQTRIAEDYVNAFLFELPQIGIYAAKLNGFWKNAPTQAIDLTGVYWED